MWAACSLPGVPMSVYHHSDADQLLVEGSSFVGLAVSLCEVLWSSRFDILYELPWADIIGRKRSGPVARVFQSSPEGH